MDSTWQVVPIVHIGSRLDGKPLADLIEVRVDLAHNAPAEATFRFVDVGQEHIGTFTLGQEVKVFLPDDGCIFRGEVTGFDIDMAERESTQLVVTAHDPSVGLLRNRKVRTFLEAPMTDILRDAIGGANLSLGRVDVGTTQFDYLMKADNALRFVNELAQRFGATWWVDPDGRFHMVSGSAPREKVECTLREDLRWIRVHTTGIRPESVVGRDWQPGDDGAQTRPIASHPPAGERSSFVAKTGAGDGETFFNRPSDGESSAGKGLRAVVDAGAVTIRGECRPKASLTPGSVLVVHDAGALDGAYPISRVVHTQRKGAGMTTRFEGGTSERPGIAALIPTQGAGPAGTFGAHHELVFAKVTNITDPDKQGRVKVNFLGLTDSDESSWARVASMGAGPDRGAIFLPEVEDDVIVGFERGDLRRPVVLGGIFTAKSKQPTYLNEDGAVNSRRMQSRLGHHIEFGDGAEDAGQHLLFSLAGGTQKLRIGKDAITLEADGKTPLTIKNGEASIVLSDGKVTIKGTDIVIQATSSVGVEGATVKATAKGEMKLEATGTLDVKSSATAKVEGAAILALKGGMVQIN